MLTFLLFQSSSNSTSILINSIVLEDEGWGARGPAVEGARARGAVCPILELRFCSG